MVNKFRHYFCLLVVCDSTKIMNLLSACYDNDDFICLQLYFVGNPTETYQLSFLLVSYAGH